MTTLRRDLRVYLAAAGLAVRAQLHYRRAALNGALVQAINVILDIVALFALLARCHRIEGWTMPQLTLLYGLVATPLGVALLLAGEIDNLGDALRRGSFDTSRTRPCRTLVLLAGQGFELRRLGRVVMGLLVLAVGLHWCHRGDAAALGICLIALMGGVACFLGIVIGQAAIAFWTVDGLEVANLLIFGGEYLASWPLPIYPRWLMRLLLSVVPIGAMTYPPALVLTHRITEPGAMALAVAAPLTGVATFALSLWLWHLGVRRHQSTGS